ncbi:MAG: DeoR/GlpR transcriptional regulator [Lentisphaeria bacterium]|nr:DeoR/GlpR transcriptional regulator [Lentisphaeria bacterium]
MFERREAIRKFIEAKGEVSIGELSAHFTSWSEMTLRRDLAALAQEKRIILTRGGARTVPSRYGLHEDIYSEREQRNDDAKQLIAGKAVELVEPDTGIFIDSGTTAMALARILPDVHLAVITAAPNIALEIAMRKAKPSVIMLGGTLSRDEIAVSDPEVVKNLENLNIDTAFMAASGYDDRGGFTVGSQLGALLKRAVVKRARKVVMMLDSSKVGTLLPFTFARVEDVDVLIGDGGLPENLQKSCPEIL